MSDDRKAYLSKSGLEEALVQHMKTILLEQPADPKAKLIELLSGGDSYYVFNSKGNEGGAKGGTEFDKTKAAVLFIEYQNEFVTEGGKLHGAVKGNMEKTGMLEKSVAVAEACRKAGVKVMHAAITFAEDASDNPNKGLGILAGCAGDKLFTKGTWNAEFAAEMTPKEGDIIVTGKKGLDAFPGTDLEALLKSNGVETLVLGGFLTNCCVESTMRTAYEKGFNVITLTDCVATTDEDGQKVTGGSYGMFSKPMDAEAFMKSLD